MFTLSFKMGIPAILLNDNTLVNDMNMFKFPDIGRVTVLVFLL